MAYSLTQQTGEARDQTQDPWVQVEWFIHYTTAAHLWGGGSLNIIYQTIFKAQTVIPAYSV